MDILSTGRQLLSAAKQRAQEIEEDLKARREVDVEGMAAGVRARLTESLGESSLVSLPVDGDLADRRGPGERPLPPPLQGLRFCRIRTSAWRTEKLRKITLSYVSMPPVIEGLALVLLPNEQLDAPVFAADLMALPVRVSVNAEVYGEEWQTRGVLSPLTATFRRIGARPGPAWAQKLASGQGLHARLRPRQVDEGFAALNQALLAYLQFLADAPPGRSKNSQEAFFQAFHDHGPRQGPLGRVMGAAWAERYSRLLFE